MSDVLQSIGNTPLIDLTGFARKHVLTARILAKREAANPFGSIKDRAALYMILEAEKSGKLPKNGTIIEPTSGNTGIGLAGVAAAKGYRVVLTMPETMSQERRKLLAAHNAQLVLTPGPEGMAGAIKKAKELLAEIPGSFMPDQFANPANALAHYETTAPEIVRQSGGGIDVFVAGVGSGGTVTGVGRYFRERDPKVRIVAAEPAESPVLSGGSPGPHGIQGIGAGFVPGVFDPAAVDEILPIPTEAAKAAARLLAQTDGLLAGISGGANLEAARLIALRPEFAGKTIVTVLPDSGERYLSTGLFPND